MSGFVSQDDSISEMDSHEIPIRKKIQVSFPSTKSIVMSIEEDEDTELSEGETLVEGVHFVDSASAWEITRITDNWDTSRHEADAITIDPTKMRLSQTVRTYVHGGMLGIHVAFAEYKLVPKSKDNVRAGLRLERGRPSVELKKIDNASSVEPQRTHIHTEAYNLSERWIYTHDKMMNIRAQQRTKYNAMRKRELRYAARRRTE
ncbi:MAG: hypothetical protein Q9209_002196 [Squamulea sp. 1 TL-2023]